jgi:hypothetical protein
MNFDIPLRYQKTANGERFLLADKIQSVDRKVQKRIIVFSTDEQLRLLFTSSHIMMDGTFDSCPPHFDQIYSIHGIKNDQSQLISFSLINIYILYDSIGFVCVLALLCGRSALIYKELFSILTQHAHRLNLEFRPARITSDFEAALIKTVAEEVISFPFSLINFFSSSLSFQILAISDVTFILQTQFIDKFNVWVWSQFIVMMNKHDQLHAKSWRCLSFHLTRLNALLAKS